MRFVVTMRLNNVKAADKLRPLLQSEQVEKIVLVRHARVPLDSPKLEQINYSQDDDFTPGWRSIWYPLLNFWHMLRVARLEKPDAVLAYNLTPYGLIAWLVARLSGCMVMVSLIGTDFNHRLRLRFIGPVLLAILRNVDRVLVFGDDARASLIARGLQAENVFALPNTTNTTVYYPDPTTQPDKDLIFVGYLRPGKRVDLILQALKNIHESRPQTSLLIVGDGDQRAALEQLAQSLGLSHAVEFYGESDAVIHQLRRARIFIMLSEHEGLPMALIEAMCAGLPGVSTSVGAVPTVIAHGQNGYMVTTPADPTRVAEYLLHLLDDPKTYAAFRESAIRLRETHSYDRATAIWTEVLQSTHPTKTP